MSLNTWLAYEGSPVHAFYCWTLFLLCGGLMYLFDFFSFVRVVSCPATLSTRFCTWLRQIRTLRRPSCAVLPVLCHQNTSSRRRHVLMHVISDMVSDILPGRDLQLTFLSVTDTYVHTHVSTYIARIDPSFKASRQCARQLDIHGSMNQEWTLLLVEVWRYGTSNAAITCTFEICTTTSNISETDDLKLILTTLSSLYR